MIQSELSSSSRGSTDGMEADSYSIFMDSSFSQHGEVLTVSLSTTLGRYLPLKSEHSLRLPRFWDSLNFKKDREFVRITVLFLDEKVNSVIHGFTPVGRANHYMPSLKAGSIVKVDRFEVSRCSSMYKITDHPFLIHFISLTIIDEVITGAPEINLQSRLECLTVSKCGWANLFCPGLWPHQRNNSSRYPSPH
ncbi:hypothetical protein F2Q69_00015625 [Brassica cretica]|uniref:DUF223 domain-containing protein n=1 Tax=Brassica cretica TaxID=69181 RepID=A0A8S9R7F9_BRACR|nr:hypothetical protein F2Q69_00015625 [Brassica cretica]